MADTLYVADAPITPTTSGSMGPYGTFKDVETAQNEGLSALQQAAASTKEVPGIWQSGIKNFDEQTQAGLGALRQKAAMALAGNRGLLGGGKGLVLSNQAALQRGAQEGEYLTGAGAERVGLQQAGNEALQKAAQQRYQNEKDIASQIETINANRSAKINNALTQAKAIVDANKGYIWTTQNDKVKMYNEIKTKLYDQELDPAVRASLKQYMDNLVSGDSDVKGTLDIG